MSFQNLFHNVETLLESPRRESPPLSTSSIHHPREPQQHYPARFACSKPENILSKTDPWSKIILKVKRQRHLRGFPRVKGTIVFTNLIYCKLRGIARLGY